MQRSDFSDRLFAGFFVLACWPPLVCAQVESVRQSEHEWQCEDQDGNKISGHVRQDKAFQSCINRAIEDGRTYIVRGGTYRITAEANQPDIPDPPVEPEELPLVTFGPVTQPTEYPPTISALKREAGRWLIRFTADSLIDKVEGQPRSNTVQGLASRDENGTVDAGHLSVWLEDIATGDHRVKVRHQDITGGQPSIVLQSQTSIVAGEEYEVVISFDPASGLRLLMGGVEEDYSAVAFGLAGNDLPLVVGALRSRYDAAAEPPVGTHAPLAGTVYMEIWKDAVPVPEPQSAEISWTIPTLRENGDPLPLSEISAHIVSLEVPEQKDLVTVDPDVANWEYVGTERGEHCFRVRTVDAAGRHSQKSNQGCKTL